jgi:hypothetical protein
VPGDLATLPQLKQRLGIGDTRDDAALCALLAAVSEAIRVYCGRDFGAADAIRAYTACATGRLFVDDLVAIAALTTDDDADGVPEAAWAPGEWVLYPTTAPYAVPAAPYWEVRPSHGTSRGFPTTPGGVLIEGTWGFGATVPTPVRDACLDQCVLQFRARSAPHGVTGAVELDTEIRTPGLGAGLHPFVRDVLDPYRLRVTA